MDDVSHAAITGDRDGDRGSDATREALVRAGERLFAERGLDSVSLREIREAAGQRNTSVIWYYFGDRSGLLKAIFEYRLPAIDARRLHILEELRRTRRLGDTRALVEAAVHPLAGELREDSWYLGFLARLPSEPRESPYRLADETLTSSATEVLQRIEQSISHLPAPLAAMRVALFKTLVVNSLAAQHSVLRAGGQRSDDSELFLANLVDSAHAMLTAPPSEATLSRRRRAR